MCLPPEPFDAGAEYPRTLYVDPNGSDEQGTGTEQEPFQTLPRAAREATPGTQIILRKGNHRPGNMIPSLHGEPDAPILISGETREGTVFSGGNTGLHFTDPRYVVIQDFTVQDASGNGINVDDAGTYETPAEYVILRNLTVRNIGPSGNRDGIKLSGVDRFRVEGCSIESPGDGGSAIDMVGCHDGLLTRNRFSQIGSTGIQAKGGSTRLLIYANYFEDGGARALNIGGSTGMQFFRPMDATAEGSWITAWANIIKNAQTPVAFVGCENCLFAHNTVYRPTKWAARILQENHHDRLIESHNNVYANNIIVFDDRVNVFVNIGPNTLSNTFLFAGNLWFDLSDSGFSGPHLPVREMGGVVQKDPLFAGPEQSDFHLQKDSPAIGAAYPLASIVEKVPLYRPQLGDYEGRCRMVPASIGAFEGSRPTCVQGWKTRYP